MMWPKHADGSADVDPAIFVHNCVLFCRLLRESGIPVSVGTAADFVTATGRINFADREAFYYTARCVLTEDHRDWPVFDAVFHAFWRRPEPSSRLEVQRPSGTGLEPLPPGAPGARGQQSSRSEQRPHVPVGSSFGAVARPHSSWNSRQEAHPVASRGDRAGNPNLRSLSPSDLVSALALSPHLPALLPRRRLRRAGVGPAPEVVDMRNTVRGAVRHHGELAELRFRDRRSQHRRLIVIGDTSKSMQAFGRAVVGLAYALSALLSDVEVFFFSTRLTRATHLLTSISAEQVLRSIGTEVTDWGGGTEIGAALGTFNRQWAGRVLSSRAVVVLVTDGLDAGDAEDLAREARILRQRSWRLVWLNPLAGGPDFEPRATGIRTLLPQVDLMLPCRDLASLFRFLDTIGSFRGWRDIDPVLTGRGK